MWNAMVSLTDRKAQEEKVREMVHYLYDQAYELFIYSPMTLYAVNKEVDFVPQKGYFLKLKETSVTENHWSLRAKNN
jgi:hypothetical protein